MGCEIYEGGTSRLTMTGEWRSKIPLWDATKCKQCLLCPLLSRLLHPGFQRQAGRL